MSYKEQASQKTQLANHVAYCKTISDKTSRNALLLKLELLQLLYSEFLPNQKAIEEGCEADDIADQFNVRATFEDSYFFCCVKIQDTIKQIDDIEATIANREGNGNEDRKLRNQEVKLPRIELIPFSGKYEDWATFHDLFSSLIHTNLSITKVQKLHYLKTNVQGDAETLLRSITITEANYDAAWAKLKERYNHKRFIVDSLLKKFFYQPKVMRESHKDLKSLIDKSSEIVQGLRLQGIQIGTWDPILVHVIVSKLDTETHKQWELKQTKDELSTFVELETFLESRWQSLEMIQGDFSFDQSSSYKNQRNNNNQHKLSSSYSSPNRPLQRFESSCLSCGEVSHKLNSCPNYSSLSVSDRKNFLKSKNLCFNCTMSGHSLMSCPSSARCHSCKGKHHTSIHFDKQVSNSSGQASSTTSNVDRKTTTTSSAINTRKNVLLATAVIYVHASDGQKFVAKALVDPGSQNTIVSTSLVKTLKYLHRKINTLVVGIGDIEVPNKDTAVMLKFSSHLDSTFETEISSIIMDKITGDLPLIPIHREEWPHLKGIQFADPHFDHPSPIEVLLGMEAYEQIIMDGLIRKQNFSPTAQNTRLGWLLFGVVKKSDNYNSIRQSNSFTSASSSSNSELNATLKSFWELEEIPEVRKFTIKEQYAETNFIKNVYQQEDGRYVVALPFNPEMDTLVIGESRKAALHSLYRMEARFRNNELLKTRYINYIQALLDTSH